MRPASIINFERLFLLSIVLGLANTLLLAPGLAAVGTPLTGAALTATIVAGAVIGTGLMVLLWWFVARRGSVVAKWIVVVVAAYTLFSLVYGFARGAMIPGPVGVSVVVAGVLQVVAVALLFRPDARVWFGRGTGTIA